MADYPRIVAWLDRVDTEPARDCGGRAAREARVGWEI
jgi:glutathione S-transferase